ncbi:MAG: hypothetical protein ACR2QG_08475 [Gammaproteobacteria bacterium]
MAYAIDQKTTVKPSDGRWLLLGVALHALILLIPLRGLMPVGITESAELVVRLMTGAPKENSEKVLPPPEFVREILEPKPVIADMVELDEPDEVVTEPPPQTTTDVSTARLMGLRDSLTEKVPLENQSRVLRSRLGDPRSYTRPENWQQHTGARALAPFENTFNGMTVPEGVEVVDRWIDADGSKNIIVETPTGHRLCGRALASDPMRPHIEQVTHFHVCGGDKRMPFKFTPRKRLNRDFIDPVAKETIPP